MSKGGISRYCERNPYEGNVQPRKLLSHSIFYCFTFTPLKAKQKDQ